MDYPKLVEAARILLTDQGMSRDHAETLVQMVIDNPEKYPNWDDAVITPAMIPECETWLSTLSAWEMEIVCCGCDETEENGPIVYSGNDRNGVETRVTIPENCCRVLNAIFDAMGYID